MNRAELKVGGIAALGGGVVVLGVNLLHPRPPADPGALLQLVAATPHWPQLHFAGVVAVLFMIGGLVLLSRNLQGEMAQAIGVLGRTLLMVSGAAAIVMVMIDGTASKTVADGLASASAEEARLLRPAALGVIHIERALFPLFSGMFLGLSSMVMGLAVTRSENFPRWLGWWAMTGGLFCLLFGLAAGFQVPGLLGTLVPVWVAGLMLIPTWGIAAGLMMLRAHAGMTAPGARAAHAG